MLDNAYFCRKIFLKYGRRNKYRITKVIDAAVNSSIDLQSVTSVRELYQKRKEELGLTDYQIQNLLEMDKNVLNPIIDGSAKFMNVVSVIKLAHFWGCQ